MDVRLVIGLWLYCSSVQASQSCSKDATLCEFKCSTAIEHKMFQCSSHHETPYTPKSLKGLTYCCPGYFKTLSGSCQVCPDKKFMRNVNNCCHCLYCSDCDSTPNNSIRHPCTRTSNTVCNKENDIVPSPGSVCPTFEVTSPKITTNPSETATTGSVDPISLMADGPQKSTGKSFRPEMIIFAFLFSVLTFFILCCCYLRYRAGSSPDKYAPIPTRGSSRETHTSAPTGDLPDGEQNNNGEQNNDGEQNNNSEQNNDGEQNNDAVQTNNSGQSSRNVINSPDQTTDPEQNRRSGQGSGNVLDYLAKKIFIVQK